MLVSQNLGSIRLPNASVYLSDHDGSKHDAAPPGLQDVFATRTKSRKSAPGQLNESAAQGLH